VDWDGDPEHEFFGAPERIQNYTMLIEANLLRASQYGNLKGNTENRKPDIHVRCDDPNDQCGGFGLRNNNGGNGNRRKDRRGGDGDGDGKHVAYNIGNDAHINFCKRYFRLDPLDQRVLEATSDEDNDMKLMRYYNRGMCIAFD
jgi:hypothetical protein